MRRANAQLQSDRRAEILAAAQRCFVRSGFHGASMQEICAEAGMSPGNLYRYFPSKEAIDRRHRRARPRRGRPGICARRSLAGLVRGAGRHGASSFRGAAGRAGPALHRGHGREPAQSGDRAHLCRLRCRREGAGSRTCCERGRARRHSRRHRFRRRRHHADDHRRRRVVAPRARPQFRPGSHAADLHGHRPPHAAQPAQRGAGRQPGRNEDEGDVR